MQQINTKKERLDTICKLVQAQDISNQMELLDKLKELGFQLTQATLSRDIKKLRITKEHSDQGDYVYRLSPKGLEMKERKALEFSGTLAVMRTKPGYASAIASDIDLSQLKAILGTVAGDDTILIILREGYDRQEIIDVLKQFIIQ